MVVEEKSYFSQFMWHTLSFYLIKKTREFLCEFMVCEYEYKRVFDPLELPDTGTRTKEESAKRKQSRKYFYEDTLDDYKTI